VNDTPERFAPPESDAGAPFWAASRDQVLRLPWCTACGKPHWYPRGFCPLCLAEDIEWRPASGGGVVYAVSVQPKSMLPGLSARVPYAVAIVDLDEGVRMMLSMDVDDPWSVAVGDRVVVGWDPLSDGRHLPVARPAPAD
jgi:uncharacterized OB-fold protein